MTDSRGLARRLDSLEREAQRQSQLRDRRLLRTLRACSPQELEALRRLLLVAPAEAERLLREIEGRVVQAGGAPTLPAALAEELRRRGGGPAAGSSGWDLATESELRELVALARGAEERDGGLRLGPVAQRRVDVIERRCELRALLDLRPVSCLREAAGCECLARALDVVDAEPRLRALGRRAVSLLARRRHVRERRRRSSGAARRRRRRERELALAEAVRPVLVERPAAVMRSLPVEPLAPEPFQLEAGSGFQLGTEAEPAPAAPRRRVRLSRAVASGQVSRGGRESDAEHLERVFGLVPGSVRDLGTVPSESSWRALRGTR